MKVVTYTLYKEHCDLYTEIHASISVKRCRMELVQKDIILLSKVSIIVYKTGKRTGEENTKFISFNLSAGTYSIDDFNAEIKMHFSNYKATFSQIHLVYLELDTNRLHLDFKILDENNNEVIPRTFDLQLLNK